MSENKSNNTSSWVKKNFKKLPLNCHLLDLACGYGQHSILAQKLGLTVTAADIDASRLAYLKNFKNITTVRLDIENKQNYWIFKNNFFDVILISKYLFRPILNNIFDSINQFFLSKLRACKMYKELCCINRGKTGKWQIYIPDNKKVMGYPYMDFKKFVKNWRSNG